MSALQLPPEIWSLIWSPQNAWSLRDIIHCACTCRTLHQYLISDDPLWRDYAIVHSTFVFPDSSEFCRQDQVQERIQSFSSKGDEKVHVTVQSIANDLVLLMQWPPKFLVTLPDIAPITDKRSYWYSAFVQSTMKRRLWLKQVPSISKPSRIDLLNNDAPFLPPYYETFSIHYLMAKYPDTNGQWIELSEDEIRQSWERTVSTSGMGERASATAVDKSVTYNAWTCLDSVNPFQRYILVSVETIEFKSWRCLIQIDNNKKWKLYVSLRLPVSPTALLACTESSLLLRCNDQIDLWFLRNGIWITHHLDAYTSATLDSKGLLLGFIASSNVLLYKDDRVKKLQESYQDMLYRGDLLPRHVLLWTQESAIDIFSLDDWDAPPIRISSLHCLSLLYFPEDDGELELTTQIYLSQQGDHFLTVWSEAMSDGQVSYVQVWRPKTSPGTNWLDLIKSNTAPSMMESIPMAPLERLDVSVALQYASPFLFVIPQDSSSWQQSSPLIQSTSPSHIFQDAWQADHDLAVMDLRIPPQLPSLFDSQNQHYLPVSHPLARLLMDLHRLHRSFGLHSLRTRNGFESSWNPWISVDMDASTVWCGAETSWPGLLRIRLESS